MADIALKRCPFCGAIPIEKTRLQLSDQREIYMVLCDNANCRVAPNTDYFFTREGARNAWNRRFDND